MQEPRRLGKKILGIIYMGSQTSIPKLAFMVELYGSISVFFKDGKTG